MRTLHSVLFAIAVSACTGSAQVHTDAEYTAPTMVEVEPGVQVIADYDEPVFYSDNMYWRYEGGIWYRSSYHNRGWARVEAPPERVRHIERPEAYVHYHAHGEVHAAGPEVRDHRTNENVITAPAPGPEVRDHREEHEHANVVTAPAPTPEVRDHRDEHANVVTAPAPTPDVRDHRDEHANEHANEHGNAHAEVHEAVEVKHDEHAEAHGHAEVKH